MFKVFNEKYYLDLNEIESFVNMEHMVKKDDDSQDSSDSGIHVNIVKFELVKTMLDVVLTEDSDIDEKMGMNSSETTIPFKIAFNTLLKNKIIKKD